MTIIQEKKLVVTLSNVLGRVLVDQMFYITAFIVLAGMMIFPILFIFGISILSILLISQVASAGA